MAVKQSVIKFLEESPFGGFYYVATASGNGRRLFWVLVVLFCVVGLITQAVIVFYHYNTAPPATSYAMEPRAHLQLPNAVVCLPVRFDKERVAKEGVSDLLGEYLQAGFIYSAVGSITGTPTGVDPANGDRLMNADPEYNQKYQGLTYQEVIDKLTFSARDILSWGCFHAGIHVDCWEGAKRIWTNYGLCYEVNSTRQAISGAGYGTMLRVETPRSRYYPGPNLAHNDGAMLKLSADGEMGLDLTLLPSGSRVQIELEVVRAKALRTDQNPCSPDPEQPFDTCLSECMISNFVDEACDCVFIDMVETDPKGNRSVCTPEQTLRCVMSSGKSSELLINDQGTAEENILMQMMSNCSAGCERSCTTWQYRKTISSFPSSSRNLDNKTLPPELHATWDSDMIIVDMYYGSMHMVVIEQFYPMTVSDLFGIFGGLLGLWLGGSVIAMVHMICFWLTSDKDGKGQT